MKKDKIKVFVATSGGVDSSVALYLLKKQGYDVTAVFIKIGESIEVPDSGTGLSLDSCWIDERRDAMRVASQLDVPFLTYDFEKEYSKEVLNYFYKEYKAGRTPNPDVMCNRQIKFSLFWKKAKSMGADMMATGHYASIAPSHHSRTTSCHSRTTSCHSREGGNLGLFASKDKEKDQSYFIYNLKSKDLEHILFPIGDLEKSDVRKIAKKAKLITAGKKDSQGLCFVGKVNVREFLKKKIKPKKGKVVTVDGEIVGEHEGVWFYTIGQRRGLGVYGGGVPYFVVDKNIEKNIIVVARESEEKKYYKDELLLEDISWVSDMPKLPLDCQARIRYRAKLEKCKIIKVKNNLKVKFVKPQRAISPGQSVVFYKGSEVLGGGIIQ